MTNLLLKLFIPNTQNHADPKVRAQVGRLSGVIGILANILLFAGKLLAGLVSGSVSIVADSMNNLSDAASSIVTLIGFKLAEKPADSEHPYGHARFEYLSGLAVAGLILVIGVELGKGSLEKILHPTPVSFSVPLALVLGGSILVKLWLCLFNRKLGRLIDSKPLLATAADCRNDVIATLAVFTAATVEWLTKWQIDGYMGMAVAVFILYSGIELAKDTISPLLGEAASPELRQLIIETVTGDSRVLGYHDLMVHDYGPGQRFASIHVEMDQKEDPLLCHEIIDDMERACLESHNVHLVIHYDPIVTGDEELDEVRDQVCSILETIDPRLSVHDFRMVRGKGHSNLIFDIVTPHELKQKEAQIRQQLNRRLAERYIQTYNTVITFDPE